jgi:dihydrofolate reductase
MATTQYYTATSIDGFIADHDNSLSWLFEVPSGDDDDGHEDRFSRFFADVGAMAMGATTYAWVVDHDDLLERPEKWREYADTPCWVFLASRAPGDRGGRPPVRSGRCGAGPPGDGRSRPRTEPLDRRRR